VPARAMGRADHGRFGLRSRVEGCIVRRMARMQVYLPDDSPASTTLELDDNYTCASWLGIQGLWPWRLISLSCPPDRCWLRRRRSCSVAPASVARRRGAEGPPAGGTVHEGVPGPWPTSSSSLLGQLARSVSPRPGSKRSILTPRSPSRSSRQPVRHERRCASSPPRSGSSDRSARGSSRDAPPGRWHTPSSWGP